MVTAVATFVFVQRHTGQDTLAVALGQSAVGKNTQSIWPVADRGTGGCDPDAETDRCPCPQSLPPSCRPLADRWNCASFPSPQVAPGGLLLRTMYSEVCGTDVHLWHGRLAGVPYPIIPGHVSIGVAEQIRGAVSAADGRPIREGDRVVFYDVHRTCGRCYACAVAGTPTKCPSRKVYGITDAAADGLFGGWSEAIYLEPGVVAAVLPDEVAPEDYMGGGCGLITAVHAIDRAAIRLADRVLVQGTGAVGLSIVALARLSGASTIIAIGAPDDRLALAGRMGATITLDLVATSAGGTPAASRRRDRRPRRRHRHRGVGLASCDRGRPHAGPRWRPLRDCRSLHQRRAQPNQRPRAHQSQASRNPRVLGQRSRALPARARRPAVTRPSHPVPGDRRADVCVGRCESRARGRRGDAAAESARRPATGQIGGVLL